MFTNNKSLKLIALTLLAGAVIAPSNTAFSQDSVFPMPNDMDFPTTPDAKIMPEPEVIIKQITGNVDEPSMEELVDTMNEDEKAMEELDESTSELNKALDSDSLGDDIYAEDVFYDAESLVPDGELARRSTRILNPARQPASRFIVVKKGQSAGSQGAKLIAASRALKLGRYESALEIYNGLIAKNKRNTSAIMGRAITLQKMDMADEAIFAYEALLNIQPDNLEARINMLGLMSKKYPGVALRQLLDLKDKNPDNVDLLAQIGIVHGYMNNTRDALKYLGIAVSMEPKNSAHYFTMAVIADKAGMKKQAVTLYEKALEVDAVYSGSRSLPRDVVFARLAKIR